MTIIRSVPIFRRRRGAVLLLALAAFWLAQAFAVAHASRHVGSDAAGLPANHAALCTDCASLLPLLAVTAVGGGALMLLRAARRTPLPAQATATVAVAPHPAFRSRAPPR